MRRALLRGLLGSVAGGLPPRRPDQYRPDSTAGVAPGPSAGALRARLVIISGPSSGMFLYSPGAPGHGNLVESVTEASFDPFTNTTQPGFASYDNTFGGVAQLHGALLKLFGGGVVRAQLGPGGLSVFNSHGALIFSVDVSRDAWFLYADTGSAAQGALIISSAVGTGTDSFGATFYPGLVNFQSALLGIVQLFAGTVLIGQPGQIAGTGGAAPAAIQLDQLATGVAGSLLLSGGLATSSDVNAVVELLSKAANATVQPVFSVNNAPVRFGVPTAPVQDTGAVLFSDAAGLLRLIVALAGDTTHYAAGHAVTPNTVAVALVQTGFTSIFGGLTVGAGNYRARTHLIVTIGGTATALTFKLTGPAVGANTSVKWWLTIESGTGQSIFAGHSLGSLAAVTLPSGTTVGAGGICHVWMSAYLQLSAGGSVNVQGETSVALSGATVAIGSTLEVDPV